MNIAAEILNSKIVYIVYEFPLISGDIIISKCIPNVGNGILG